MLKLNIATNSIDANDPNEELTMKNQMDQMATVAVAFQVELATVGILSRSLLTHLLRLGFISLVGLKIAHLMTVQAYRDCKARAKALKAEAEIAYVRARLACLDAQEKARLFYTTAKQEAQEIYRLAAQVCHSTVEAGRRTRAAYESFVVWAKNKMQKDIQTFQAWEDWWFGVSE